MFEVIKLKDTSIKMRDINQLSENQIKKIRKVSQDKTFDEWTDPLNKNSVKIDLVPEQIKHVLETKNYIFKNKRAVDLLLENIIEFSLHAEKRAALRIEDNDPDCPLDIKTKLKIIELIIKSNEISSAEWKGYPYLSYNLRGVIYNEKVTVSVAFKNNIWVVTIITPKKNSKESWFNIGELLDDKTIDQLKKHSQ